MKKQLAVVAVLGASFALNGCSDGLVADQALTKHQWPIINGTRPPETHPYDAVVSLHESSKRGISVYPFCSGTLISADVVLTAAHCLSGTRPNKVVIYFGSSPVDEYNSGTLTIDDFHAVSEIWVHPEYNSAQITNDIAMARLAQPVSVTPVPALPAAEGFTSSDEGSLTLDFAGFGQDENGDYGVKLHAEGVLDHIQSPTQIYYYQYDSGPCFGDSGGPAFVTRNGTVYVGGLTSYGDSDCAVYGVSTRTDAYESEIAAFTGGSGGGGGDGGGDTGQCLPKGSQCSSNDECCSGKCGGKPGRKKCR